MHEGTGACAYAEADHRKEGKISDGGGGIFARFHRAGECDSAGAVEGHGRPLKKPHEEQGPESSRPQVRRYSRAGQRLTAKEGEAAAPHIGAHTGPGSYKQRAERGDTHGEADLGLAESHHFEVDRQDGTKQIGAEDSHHLNDSDDLKLPVGE